MLHRQRVSGEVVAIATLFEMLLSAQAAVLYYGVLHNDPHTAVLAGLAATGSGSVALMVFTALWMGVTINVGSCPAAQMPVRHYPDMNRLNADTVAIAVASDRTEWILHYSTAQWRGLSKMLQAGYNNLPYRACHEYAGFSRDEWERFKADIVRAGLANRKKGGEVVINDAGRRAIFQYARTPLPHEVEE